MSAAGTGLAAAPTQVPLLDLQAQYRPIRDEILAVVTRVCDSQRFIMGPEVEALERELAALLGVTHAVGVSSGTDALLLALMALGIGPGDEVITTHVLVLRHRRLPSRASARRPVLRRHRPGHLQHRPAQPSPRPSRRGRKAIMPVHLYGQCADMDPIARRSRARAGVPVIEDAAQAIGATYHGRPVGRHRRARLLLVLPEQEPRRVRRRRPGDDQRRRAGRRACGCCASTALEPKYYHHVVGGNFRLDALQAAVLRVKVPHLAAWTEARRAQRRAVPRAVRDAGLDRARDAAGRAAPDRTHIYNQFVDPRAATATRVKAHLDARGIGTEIYYPVPFHLQECFAYLGLRGRATFPHAERAARETLALPIYGELTDEQQRYVVAAIARRSCAARPDAARMPVTLPDARPASRPDARRRPRAAACPASRRRSSSACSLGIVVGYVWPAFGVAIKPLADAFLRMIKMIIAPLLFSTLVVGIAGTGDLKAMGRIGLKAIIYFEVATTIALVPRAWRW